jgi:hypothetical protein
MALREDFELQDWRDIETLGTFPVNAQGDCALRPVSVAKSLASASE